MLPASFEFILFSLLLFIVFYTVKTKYRTAVLLLGSIGYVSFLSIAFLVYVFLFILNNYWVGLKLSTSNEPQKKYLLLFGQALNLGGLIFYKYINFFIENLNLGLGLFNELQISSLHYIIPIGISYYTFQGISYLYLIYKAGDKPESNFINFALYMIYFPKLVAGPIERHRKFLPQLKGKLEFDYDRVVSGVRLITIGLFKKVVVGDTFFYIINRVYGNIDSFDGYGLIITLLIQPMQIYFDFSGYTDIAIGLSALFGIQLSQNFNAPFFATSVGDFWRRWHMSLSSWCNDFIYNRLMLKYRKWNNWAVIYAVFATFIIIGIWHGAKWTFVILGLLQGVAITLEYFKKKYRIQTFKYILGSGKSEFRDWVNRIYVYLFFAFSLIFFYAPDMNTVSYFLSNLFVNLDVFSTSVGFGVDFFEFILAFVLMVFFIRLEWQFIYKGRVMGSLLNDKGVFFRWSLYLFSFFLIVYMGKNQGHFVYAQF